MIEENDYTDYFRALINESDRGCLLLIAAYLDDQLVKLHQTHIEHTSSPSKELLKDLFNSNGPLSSFSARIKIAYTYGLLEKKDFDDLERLRKLRNDVAHNIKNFSFEDAHIRKKIYELQAPRYLAESGVIPLTEEEKTAIQNPGADKETAKIYLILSGIHLDHAISRKLISILQTAVARLQNQQSSDKNH